MITIIAVGKRHEPWLADGIARYEQRMTRAWQLQWKLLPASQYSSDAARREESQQILRVLSPQAYVVLLDERGTMLDSPALSRSLHQPMAQGKWWSIRCDRGSDGARQPGVVAVSPGVSTSAGATHLSRATLPGAADCRWSSVSPSIVNQQLAKTDYQRHGALPAVCAPGIYIHHRAVARLACGVAHGVPSCAQATYDADGCVGRLLAYRALSSLAVPGFAAQQARA